MIYYYLSLQLGIKRNKKIFKVALIVKKKNQKPIYFSLNRKGGGKKQTMR